MFFANPAEAFAAFLPAANPAERENIAIIKVINPIKYIC